MARLGSLGFWAGQIALYLSLSTGCSGGCSGITAAPKPMPASQTIEGGAQLRITRSGLTTIGNAVEDIVNQQFANGIDFKGQCNLDLPDPLPQIDYCDTAAPYCNNNQDINGPTSGTCHAAFQLTQPLGLTTNGGSTVHVDATFNAQVTGPVHIWSCVPIFGCGTGFGEGTIDYGTCHFNAAANGAHVAADIILGTNSSNGQLTVALGTVSSFNLNASVTSPDGIGCQFIAGVVDALASLLSSSLGTLIINLVRPLLNNFIQGLLPNPLGIAGVLNVGSLLSAVAPGVKANMEVLAVPGGYVSTPASGISMGIIVGLNADSNTNTRTAGTESEPVRCIPAWPTPDLANVPPAVLTRVPGRNTFALAGASEFMGVPDPAGDLAIGLSRTVLNQAGRHLIASGALCLGVGSQTLPQLNLGTVGILVQSLAELGNGREPVLMQLRPTSPITFDVGTGSTQSPNLTLHLKNLEVDFYALIYERYIRAFTLSVTTDVGLNLMFSIDAQGKPIITPMLVGLNSTNIMVKISNSEFLRESAAQLEAVFPTLLNLLLPALANGIPPFPVPSISGFTLSNLSLHKVTTTQDVFLAIYSGLVRARAIQTGLPAMPGDEEEPLDPPRAVTRAQVVRVIAPSPEKMRSALYGEPGGEMPSIELSLDGDAPNHQPLEWQWRLDGGMWREFNTDPHPVLRDLAFGVQGRHTITVRAREIDNYESTELEGVTLPVVIDSVGPRVIVDQMRRDGDELIIPAVDLVTADEDVLYAFGPATSNKPTTAWAKTMGHVSVGEVRDMLDASNKIHVFTRDELGNESLALVDVSALLGITPPAQPNAACGCEVGGSGGGGGPAAIVGVLLALGLLARRRLVALWRIRTVRRVSPLLVVGLIAVANPGCDCSSHPEGLIECSVDTDCATFCPPGQVGYCGDNGMCICKDDIPMGIIGQYSRVAVSTHGIAFVSAYNSTYGDLMVGSLGDTGRIPDAAWDFVDGVPAGPVAIPQSTVRHGIRAAGPDVGVYTSIGMTGADEPVVSYYDRTNLSLRFAGHFNGAWVTYAVDAGVPGTSGKDLGRYSAITVDKNGRPGIAYMAVLHDGGNGHAEVRWAQSRVAHPGPTDWAGYPVENLAIPTPPPNETMLDDVPWQDGLFIAVARKPDDSPVVVWYDRPNHDLKLAEFDLNANRFKTPVVLDGATAGLDVGWYPSLAVTADGKSHVTYVDAQRTQLLYIDYPGGTPTVIDDGYRIDGVTADGLPRPVFHFVGDNSGLVQAGGMQGIVYQDATTHELLLATKGANGWEHTSVAGFETPFKGAYGFFASGALTGDSIVMSTYVIDQPNSDYWVEIFRQRILIQ